MNKLFGGEFLEKNKAYLANGAVATVAGGAVVAGLGTTYLVSQVALAVFLGGQILHDMYGNRTSGKSQNFKASMPNASTNLQDTKTQNIALKVLKSMIACPYQVAHRLAGLLVLPAQNPLLTLLENTHGKREKLKTQLSGKEIEIETADSVSLSAMYFPGNKACDKDKTVILFSGNGVRYEQYGEGSLLLDITSWQEKGWNVVVFNHRGVGKSHGMATRDGLVLDGDALLQYVRDQRGVPEDKILLHGHSLGGGIATEVAAMHPKVNICNDRSFASLSKQVKVMFGNGVIGTIASWALVYLGWEYDSIGNWDKIKGKKIVVFHENDTVIPIGARLADEFIEGGSISMDHGLVLVGARLVIDDRDTIKEEIVSSTSLISKISLCYSWLIAGQLAHMRGYEWKTSNAYFKAIGEI